MRSGRTIALLAIGLLLRVTVLLRRVATLLRVLLWRVATLLRVVLLVLLGRITASIRIKSSGGLVTTAAVGIVATATMRVAVSTAMRV